MTLKGLSSGSGSSLSVHEVILGCSERQCSCEPLRWLLECSAGCSAGCSADEVSSNPSAGLRSGRCSVTVLAGHEQSSGEDGQRTCFKGGVVDPTRAHCGFPLPGHLTEVDVGPSRGIRSRAMPVSRPTATPALQLKTPHFARVKSWVARKDREDPA